MKTRTAIKTRRSFVSTTCKTTFTTLNYRVLKSLQTLWTAASCLLIRRRTCHFWLFTGQTNSFQYRTDWEQNQSSIGQTPILWRWWGVSSKHNLSPPLLPLSTGRGGGGVHSGMHFNAHFTERSRWSGGLVPACSILTQQFVSLPVLRANDTPPLHSNASGPR